MNIIDGKTLANEALKLAMTKIEKNNLSPRLDIVLVGDNIASKVYVSKKVEAAEKVGVEVVIHKYKSISENGLIELISELNENIKINAIIVQLPLPDFDPTNAISHISTTKDVDGLNPSNLGKLWQGNGYSLVPATALAIFYAIEHVAKSEGISIGEYLKGKYAVIVNRSVIIGKPIAALLLSNDATITIAHSKTKNLRELTTQADILISGTGQAGLITANMIKQNAVVIDTGFNKNEKGMWGDIDKNSIKDTASWLSPVPGGIGPLGVAMLISNTIDASYFQVRV